MSDPRVLIMMATYNGAAYLQEQLDSFDKQTYTAWDLLVSDDGSRDETLTIINEAQVRLGASKIKLRQGPRRGYAANFLSMLLSDDQGHHSAQPSYAYYAFADQDDVWVQDKIQRAVAWLSTIPKHQPALYCSRTELIRSDGTSLGLSTHFKKKSGFRHALVQNLGGGNTMVFNQAACAQLQACTAPDTDLAAHDWWTYLVVTGCGGLVHYDETPSLLYRQHAHSQLGMNRGWSARKARIMMLFRGVFKQWNDKNCQALQRVEHQLTEENRRYLQRFMQARRSVFFLRLTQLMRLGVYRQTLLGQLGLGVAALFNKV